MLQAAALAPVVETGEYEDVKTRVRLRCDRTQAFAELRYGAVVHTRENIVKYGHNLGQTLYGNRISSLVTRYVALSTRTRVKQKLEAASRRSTRLPRGPCMLQGP